MDYEKALEWVHSLPRLAEHPGVENEKKLLEKLGNPEKSLKFVHIAGTNGKGSTTMMMSNILKCAGYRVGATISPYVLDFRERFQINGEMIGKDVLAEVLTQVRKAVEALENEGWDSMVEFDVVTAAALVWFAKEKCDIVCMETGLGGRLDATNAVENTLVACITAIGKDHTELLGDTLEKIAREKCGIFKKGCTVVCYPEQEKEVMAVVQEQAKQYHAPIRMPEQEDFYFYRGQSFENRVNYGGYDLNIAMPGKHQAYNAGVAIEIALALCDKGFDISDEAIIEGIEETKFPARIEVFCKRPPLILDGMHNVQGAKALASVLEQEKVKHLTLVIGVLHGKGEEKMLELLAPYADRCCTVTPDSPRAIPAQELAQTAKRYYRETAFFESVPQALRHAMQFAENGLLICGSLYLAAEVRSLLEKTANTTV